MRGVRPVRFEGTFGAVKVSAGGNVHLGLNAVMINAGMTGIKSKLK